MAAKKYPDVSELFRRREAARRESAQMPVAQKMEVAARLRDASAALAATRAANKARRVARRSAQVAKPQK
jgi:hypothetical protein